MSAIPTITYWRGKPINEEMSKKELLEIINWFGRQELERRKEAESRMEMFRLFESVK